MTDVVCPPHPHAQPDTPGGPGPGRLAPPPLGTGGVGADVGGEAPQGTAPRSSHRLRAPAALTRSPPSARCRPAPRATWLLPPAQVLLSAYGVVTFRCGRAGCGFVSHFRARDSHFSPLESPVLQFWKILGRSLFECCLFPVRFCLPAETLRSQDVPPGPPRLRPALGHPVPRAARWAISGFSAEPLLFSSAGSADNPAPRHPGDACPPRRGFFHLRD